jgi:hypothetical protein
MSPSRYETSNVYLASFLLCLRASFVGFQRVSKRRFLFFFQADEKLHELLRQYWRNVEIMVVPARLFAALQRLKSLTRGSPVGPLQSVTPAPHAER